MPITPATREYFAQFRRKRWATSAQAETFLACERDVGSQVMVEAVRWAARKGTADIDSICTAARNWGNKPRRSRTGQANIGLSPDGRKLVSAEGIEPLEDT